MKSDWKTYGHGNSKGILERQLEAQKYPHAFLFVGPEGVGKKHLALEFAAKILTVPQPLSHPDFSMLDQDEEISVEQVRNFIANVGFKPFRGPYKIAVINNAHLLNVQGSNALLKTLEEPGPSSILILISSEKPLPTIVSRCQVLTFNSFTLRQLRDYASQRGLDVSEDALLLSSGSIARLEKFAGSSEDLKDTLGQVKDLEKLPGAATSQKLLLVPKFAELETNELENLFVQWLYREKAALKTSLKHAKVMEAILCALEELKTNKNKKLILQSLFLKI